MRTAPLPPAVRRVVQVVGPALAIVATQLVLYPAPLGVLFLGVVLGSLFALVAVGMALIYRSNRILNFAQADLGAAPTVLAVLLITVTPGLGYFLGLAVGMVAALALGALVELVIIRRFFRSPRLILTVATIGLSQLLTVGASLLPRMTPFHVLLIDERATVPWDVRFEISGITFTGDHLLPLVVAPVLLAALALFLRATATGVAIRASAERGDRARGLGVPVKRLQTVVWALATVLSFAGVFLRAAIFGLPQISALSFGALLTALAALVLGRLTDLPAIAASAVALGVLEQAVIWNSDGGFPPGGQNLVYPVLGVVVIVALLLRRTGSGRTEYDTAASWQASEEVRPVPAELRHLPEVWAVRWGGGAALLAAAVALPLVLGPSNELKAAVVAVFVIVAVSIVLLTGWAGQVSLGQMAFVAVGSAVGAVCTVDGGYDLSLSLLLAGGAGAVVAVLVGLPALRLRGLFLAVTTLAFAVATTSYLLNRSTVDWLPREPFERARLFNRFDLTEQSAMYHVCLAVMVLALVAVHGIRRSRTGRVLLALRDNERGVQAFGVSVTRAKLTAFALSGFLAAVAGCLYGQILGSYSEQPYEPSESFLVFTAAVVGGLGSLTGAVAGALYLNGGEWILSGDSTPVVVRFLPSAFGVLIVLLALPGGLGQLVFRLRDSGLRRVAARRGIVVPSLVADLADPEPPVVPSDDDLDASVVTSAAVPGQGVEV